MRKAFTLIELLVVIAIIAILAAILFPVFAQAKTAAKKSADLSNTKQLNLGVQMYQADVDDMNPVAIPDNNGTTLYTTPWDRTPTSNPSGRQTMWANSVQPYIKNWAIYKSPGGDKAWLPFGDPAASNPTGFALSYYINSYLNAYPASGMPSPAKVTMLSPVTGSSYIPGYSYALPLVLTKTGSWLAGPVGAGSFPGVFQFQRSGNYCVSGFGIFGGSLGKAAVFGNGYNNAYADGHSKYVPIKSGDSFVAGTNAAGEFASYWVFSADYAQGCGYSYIHSPFFGE